MKCLFPFVVAKYKEVNIKGYPCKVFDGRVSVPCGRCPACRRRKQNEWAFRCMQEAKHSNKTAFITLTYDDDHLPISDLGQPTLCKHHLQKYFKDLRYWLGDFRYYACGEYGDKFGRPHYHALVFYNGDKSFEDFESIITSRWIYGISDFQQGVTPANAKYCCKYSMKSIGFDYGDCVPPFALMSRRPGIGKKFIEDINIDVFRRYNIWSVHDEQGTPYPIPRYYRPYIYNKNELDIHSQELQRLFASKDDFHLIEYSQSCTGNFYQTELEIALSYEREFIKKLRNELYEFKYTLPNERRQSRYSKRLSSDDLVSDEF